jgi:two-component system, OmpR family, sensor histidine kinase KdpD
MPEIIPVSSPDEVLARAKSAGKQPERGKLKIFLGYCAGVGKTYAMLEAAHEIKSETDVVIGYVETHARKETEGLLEGIEILPRRQVEHRGIAVPEMDLDGLLARHPALALVDELAHSNAPGTRHLKRYQDVQELLDAGIDVYTTLNVQHVESLRDVVAQITGIWMRETVPDSVIDSASEIELVDLPPDELIKRLKEGKVYLAEQAALATDQFFRKGNLLALRELAMRIAAERVDEQVRAYKDTHAIREQWPTTERILVCVSPSSSGTKLVRTARRLAAQLDAPWMALYVETPDAPRLSSEKRQQIGDTLRLAVRLGAKEATIQGNSVADTVIEYARQNGWTKIIVGRPQKRTLWRVPGSTVADQLIHRSENTDIYVVSGTGDVVERQSTSSHFSFGKWRGYLAGVVLVALSTLLGHLLRNIFDPTNIIMIYLLGVMAVASIWGLGPSMMTSLLSVLAFDFFLVPPILTFAVRDTQYIFTFIVLLLVGIALSYLSARVRRQVEAAQQREHEIVTLYSTARTLALTVGIESIVNSIVGKAKEVFGREATIFLPDPHEQGKLLPRNRESLKAGENDTAAATWSFEHKQTAGFGTDTLPDARARFLPLVTSRGIVGVLALWKIDAEAQMPTEQERLLEAFSDLAAVAIERTQLVEEARNAQVLQASEKLQTALLNSVSHDLRTPLVSIIGTLGSLKEKSLQLSESDREALISVALEQGDRLNHLISNLLDVSRIEAGAVILLRQPTDFQEVLGIALGQMKSRLEGRQVDVQIPKNLPYVWIDSSVIAQVLVNLLDNAIKYSPKGFPIEISTRKSDDFIEIQVDDFGVGIPKEDLARVFDKFYRVHRPDNVAGSGLGLSIAKGFIEAHGGTITAQNRQGGGTIVKFSLPIAKETPGNGR